MSNLYKEYKIINDFELDQYTSEGWEPISMTSNVASNQVNDYIGVDGSGQSVYKDSWSIFTEIKILIGRKEMGAALYGE